MTCTRASEKKIHKSSPPPPPPPLTRRRRTTTTTTVTDCRARCVRATVPVTRPRPLLGSRRVVRAARGRPRGPDASATRTPRRPARGRRRRRERTRPGSEIAPRERRSQPTRPSAGARARAYSPREERARAGARDRRADGDAPSDGGARTRDSLPSQLERTTRSRRVEPPIARGGRRDDDDDVTVVVAAAAVDPRSVWPSFRYTTLRQAWPGTRGSPRPQCAFDWSMFV